MTFDFTQEARLAGATDENGRKATDVFCFNEQELKQYTQSVVRECNNLLDSDSVQEKLFQHFQEVME